ncbi:hypothetical protein GCM10023346_01430 [Arthrobacter gyeryongensis]|uniref:Uncharacterized protein n=1 Tax=Arthrobacter gyeryongensis TaxID=1650592 RepID=A0ABP9RZK0_9MICC
MVPTRATDAGEEFLSKLLDSTAALGINGISCCGNPGTRAPTVAEAPAAAVDVVASAGLAEAVDDVGAAPWDAVPAGDDPQAEMVNATPVANKARLTG